ADRPLPGADCGLQVSQGDHLPGRGVAEVRHRQDPQARHPGALVEGRWPQRRLTARAAVPRGQGAPSARGPSHPAAKTSATGRNPDFTQELTRKLPPTRAKEAQRRRRKQQQSTRRSLWRIGYSRDLKRAHNPKVAGSNPAPATTKPNTFAVFSRPSGLGWI